MRSLAAFGTPLSLSDFRIWENTLGSISAEDAFPLACLAAIVFCGFLGVCNISHKSIEGGWATSSVLAKSGRLTPLLLCLLPPSAMSLIPN